MLRLSVKSVRGHLVRFLLTALAVTLGVAFVAGSFVLRDSIDRTLGNLLDNATKGLDVAVRGEKVKDGQSLRLPVPVTLAARLAQVDGVARSAPDLQGDLMLVGKDGLVVRNAGAPTFGFAFRTDDPSFTVVRGRGPTGPEEIAVEKTTLAKSGLSVGDTTRAVVGGQSRQVRITGEVTFGSLFGATAVLVDEATARSAFAADGMVSSISLTARPGVSQGDLRNRVGAELRSWAEKDPLLEGLQAVTGQAIADEVSTEVQKGLGFFTTFLLVFAGITLFVGAFIIANTFSILLAQRTRELALLRALGASHRQVVRMVLGEAVIIGMVGSVLGIALGAGLAMALKAVIKTVIGVDITGGLPVNVRTIGVSVAVGVVVTLVSAWLPARRASRVPPVAALRDDLVAAPSSIRRRGLVGLVVLTIGVGILAWGVTRSSVNWLITGTGAGLTVIGALVAAPLATRPVVRVLLAPFLRFTGVVGRLASRNALRVPRRTANTASALMIGLALVATLSVLASSTKASVAGLVSQQLTSDYVLSTGGSAAVPVQVAKAAAGLPGVGSVATLSTVEVAVGDIRTQAIAVSGTALAENVHIEVGAGSIGALDRGQVLVNLTTATQKRWRVGSVLDATVGTLSGQRLTVGGIFADNQLLDTPFVVGRDLYARALPVVQQKDVLVLVRVAPGADTAAVRAGLTDLVKPYLIVSVETADEYVDSAAAQVDQLLGLLYVLLALSIVIAVLGIINTLALSVVERTREIGLLRAVGLTRRQLSQMITVESVATAVFGAVLGAGLGLGLGVALQHGLRSGGLDTLSIPWVTIVTVLVASGVVGVIAAVLPAVRAVRLNILEAIATE